MPLICKTCKKFYRNPGNPSQTYSCLLCGQTLANLNIGRYGGAGLGAAIGAELGGPIGAVVLGLVGFFIGDAADKQGSK